MEDGQGPRSKLWDGLQHCSNVFLYCVQTCFSVVFHSIELVYSLGLGLLFVMRLIGIVHPSIKIVDVHIPCQMGTCYPIRKPKIINPSSPRDGESGETPIFLPSLIFLLGHIKTGGHTVQKFCRLCFTIPDARPKTSSSQSVLNEVNSLKSAKYRNTLTIIRAGGFSLDSQQKLSEA